MSTHESTIPKFGPAPLAPLRSPAGNRVSTRAALGRGVARGFLPLFVLLMALGVAVAVTLLAWQITPGFDFFTRRAISVGVVGVTLIASVVLYAMACRRALHRVTLWLESGDTPTAIGALVALGLTAVIVVLPVLLAVLLPQHPAP